MMDNSKTTEPQTASGAITPELIKDLKAKHGTDLHLLELTIGDELCQVVVKSPGPEYDEWRDQRDAEGATVESKRIADRNFVNAVRVWPGGPEWLAMTQKRRGLASTFAGELAELSGVSRNTRRKKL